MGYNLRVNTWPPPDCQFISHDKQQLQWCFSIKSARGMFNTAYMYISCVCFYVLIKQPGGGIQQQDEVDQLTP